MLKVLSRIEESGLQQTAEPDLSQYSKSIFEQVNRRIDNPLKALREAKKIAIENLGSIFEEIGKCNFNNPIFSKQTFLRVLSELQNSNKIGIDKGFNDVFTDLNQLNIFIDNKSNPKSDDLLYLAELYTRLARILYEERLKIKLRKGVSVPKPSTPIQPQKMACSGITVTQNSLYATVSLIDKGGRVFPINNALGPENFKIFETHKSKKSGPLKVRAVVPLLDTKTQIKILFVLDNSGSMFEPVPNLASINKIDIAKNSLIFLLNGLKDSLAGGLDALVSVSVLVFDEKSCKYICDSFGNRWLSDFELLSSEKIFSDQKQVPHYGIQ